MCLGESLSYHLQPRGLSAFSLNSLRGTFKSQEIIKDPYNYTIKSILNCVNYKHYNKYSTKTLKFSRANKFLELLGMV